MKGRSLVLAPTLLVVALVTSHCSGPDAGTEPEGYTGNAMSTKIASVYGMTTFGGPGDYQSVACGGNSKTINQYYVASSQRYGCNVHLKLTSGSKCLVVYTADAGPATFVETDAHIAVLDSSPTVTKYFFGLSGLGWSDLADNPGKYNVHAEITKDALGPCSGTSTPPAPTSTPTSTGTSTSPPPPPPPPPSSTTCSGDGDCNPGNDGSGLICKSGVCVPGCHNNAQCPGIKTCVSGMCK